MIKLNNKNITYVALADSNNSLKAPKEIWYADSSNSVKLVYRRKDALIEGEDYEKYHWLQGRNGAYIDTNYKIQIFDDAFQIRARINDPTEANPDGGEQDLFGVMKNSGDRCICFYQRNFGRLCFAYSNIQNGGNQVFFVNKNIFDATMYADQSNFFVTCNGETLSQTVGTLSALDNRNIALFQLTTEKSNNYFHGDIAYFRITDPTFNVDKVNMIPCQLLKPLPKWLDANGIRRQIGECGMIDLVSGKFYGNVNSVGTFTVENYYERKEWLVGDGSAYIDTMITEVNQNIITLNAIVDDSINGQALFGAEDTTVSPNKRVFVRYNQNNSKKLIIYDNNPSRQVATDTIVNLVFSDDGNVYLNGNEVTTYSSPLSLTDSILLFAAFLRNSQGTSIQNSANMKVSHFSISDRINLVPCTLTMDLPASMDANNIARTKGTSGMWDLVSDKFYGNVANSGTFKAVNLAEGVDYEVHQWLVGDGEAYINTTHNTNEVLEYETSVSNLTFGKCLFWFRIGGYAENKSVMIAATDNTTYKGLRVANVSSEARLSQFESDNVVVSTDSNSIYINGIQYPCIKSDDASMIIRLFYSLYNDATSDSVKCAYFRLLSNNSIVQNLIPIRLLRPIPSKYDANGIARQAGECGMYDTVNDLFYGNVASSGSFTVSDDN